MRVQKIAWLGGLLITICVIIYKCYLDDFIQEYSVNRVEKEIIKNYDNNKNNFADLLTYAKAISDLPTIIFLDADKIESFMYPDSINLDSSCFDLLTLTALGQKMEKISLLSNGSVEIHVNDTIMIIPCWTWAFEGGKGDLGYDFLLKKLDITDSVMDSVRTYVRKVNCRSVRIDKDNIYLRFYGTELCKFEYLIAKNNAYDSTLYHKLGENVYWSIKKDDQFCGDCFGN